MAKRIATQLAEALQDAIDNEAAGAIEISVTDARRWLRWAQQLDARMRLDGSKLNRKRKPTKVE